MKKLVWGSILVTALLAVSVGGLKCHQGFNFSVGGLPFYFWNETRCLGRSDCFIQEIASAVPQTHLEVAGSFGGCISRSYSSLITCKKIFNVNSDLNIANIFNMLQNIDSKFDLIDQRFRRRNNGSAAKMLFSNGTGTESFVDGFYAMMKNMGFNMEKALPLRSSLINLLNASLPYYYRYMSYSQYVSSQYYLDKAGREFLEAIGKLDTKNSTLSSDLHTFLGNFLPYQMMIGIRNATFAPLINNLPGLIKSMLPESFKVDMWYDLLFKILGNVNKYHIKESAQNILTIVKNNFKMSEYFQQLIDPVIQYAPVIVEKLLISDYETAADWSIKLLSAESTLNEETKNLSNAISKLLTRLFGKAPENNIVLLIRWTPGLFYKLFPGKGSEIGHIYKNISESVEGMDFKNLNPTAKETKMSKFVIWILEKSSVMTQGTNLTKQEIKKIVVHLSRAMYDAMPDFQNQLDTIFSSLIDGLEHWPQFNAGKILNDLMKNLGWQVPRQIKPLLDYLQDFITPFYTTPSGNVTAMTESIMSAAKLMAEAYESEYRESELPNIVVRLIEAVINITQISTTNCYNRYRYPYYDYQKIRRCWDDLHERIDEIYSEMFNVSVDIYFATFKEIDRNYQFIFKDIEKVIPDFDIYLHITRALNSTDIQIFYEEYHELSPLIPWNVLPFQRIVWIFYYAVENISTKLKNVTTEIRSLITPDSCKYIACRTELCNSHESITAQKPYSRPTAPPINDGKKKADPTVEPITTTSHASKVYSSVAFNVMIAWVSRKVA